MRRLASTASAVVTSLAVLLAVVGTAPGAAGWTPTSSAWGGPDVDLIGTGITFTDIPAHVSVGCVQHDLAGSIVNPGLSRSYGSATAALPTVTTASCAGSSLASCAVTPVGSWSLAVTGDRVPPVWPARVDDVTMTVECFQCAFTIQGTINGGFNDVSQVFTPVPGASGLVIATGTGAPAGTMCDLLDLQATDDIEVGGYWTNHPPAGSTPLRISNP
ncbi:hypothetical protein ABFU82_18990 [Nocardioides sp. WV_118_6]